MCNKSRLLFWKVPGPCEPEDLIDGIIFAANYLGCTQVLSDKNPSKSVRMSQAHEAVSQIKVMLLLASTDVLSEHLSLPKVMFLLVSNRLEYILKSLAAWRMF